ncbi:MAG: hypothetical protein U0528_18595 [Anaerolineae bacterium]|nr:NIPSNAP family protein [Anaerolineae bacterium]
MQVKVIMSWDIKPGRDQEYFEFVVREFAPSLQRIGMQPTEAWYTVYGERPQIMMAAIADDLEKMKELLNSADWKMLQSKLMDFIINYSEKIVRATPFFPMT